MSTQRIADLKHELALAEHDLAVQTWRDAVAAFTAAAADGPSTVEANLHQQVVQARETVGKCKTALEQAKRGLHRGPRITFEPPKPEPPITRKAKAK